MGPDFERVEISDEPSAIGEPQAGATTPEPGAPEADAATPEADTATPEPREPEPEPRRRRWSPGIAAGLSFLWPGLGQLFLGRRRRAAILAVPALLVAVVAVLQLSQGALWFVLSLWDPGYVAVVVVTALGLAMLRIAAIADAFVGASRAHRPGRLGIAFAGVLIVMVVATHGVFVAGTWMWYQASVDVQNNDLIPNATDTPPPLADASASPTADPSSSPSDDTNLIIPDSSPTPTSTPGRNPDRVTIVLIGYDSLAGRAGSANTDTMMLISIDKKTEQVSIVSVPRDTTNFYLYYGGHASSTFKLNTLYISATRHDWPGPDKPLQTVEKEIAYLVGVPADYYAAVSLAGMAAMIDTLGGIDFYNPNAIHDPETGISMGIGQVHLNGATAILYVRSREHGGSDYKRAARQQALLVALEKKMVSPAGLTKLPRLLSLAGKVFETDFPLSTARDYVPYAQNISSIKNCVLGPPYSIHPDPSTTGGKWTTYLDMNLVASLSIYLFGKDSRYYETGIPPAPCKS